MSAFGNRCHEPLANPHFKRVYTVADCRLDAASHTSFQAYRPSCENIEGIIVEMTPMSIGSADY